MEPCPAFAVFILMAGAFVLGYQVAVIRALTRARASQAPTTEE